MKSRIGEVAGHVWHALDKGGPMSLAGLAVKVKGATQNEVLMAIGWLAREDQIDFATEGKTTKVAVKKR